MISLAGELDNDKTEARRGLRAELRLQSPSLRIHQWYSNNRVASSALSDLSIGMATSIEHTHGAFGDGGEMERLEHVCFSAVLSRGLIPIEV